MNHYVKEFFLRGLIFSGFGPIVAGIVYVILELNHVKIEINGYQIFLAILSTYLCAFIQAGSSVFPQIESWSKVKALFFQMISIYVVYLAAYLINGWIPKDIKIILIFTGSFIFCFLTVWLIAYLTSRRLTNKMNEKLNGGNQNE